MKFIFYGVILGAALLVSCLQEIDNTNDDKRDQESGDLVNNIDTTLNVSNEKESNVNVTVDAKESSIASINKESTLQQPIIPTVKMDDNETVLHVTTNMSNMKSNTSDLPDSKFSKPDDEDLKKKQVSETLDEIPTFVEYQQKLELESKQKRERSDTVPSPPTMIIKDNQIVKGSIESRTLSTKDTQETGTNIKSVKESTVQGSQESLNPPNQQKFEEVKQDSTSSTLTKKLLKNNVAAKECGAKILDFSSQITHANFVLNSNKDEYLNVPCSAPEKWFIFETCEPVRIRSVQIGSFEMFSSRPKTFRISASDRYPVKHWQSFGTFKANDEKGLQTFDVSNSAMVKYIKFEMLDYYGTEHYCPLTFVRVLGNIILDYDFNNEESDMSDDGNEIKTEEKSDGLLKKAKDIIAKMVNGIGGSKQAEENVDQAFGKNNIDGAKNSDINVDESPCYILKFLLNDFRISSDALLNSFRNIYSYVKLVKPPVDNSFDLILTDLPFPYQVRFDFFFLNSVLNKSEYQFVKLYRSFSNLTLGCTNSLCQFINISSLADIFRCRFPYQQTLVKMAPLQPVVSDNKNATVDLKSNTKPTVETPSVSSFQTFSDRQTNGKSSSIADSSVIQNQKPIPSTTNIPIITDESSISISQDHDKEKSHNPDNKTISNMKEVNIELSEQLSTDSTKISGIKSQQKIDDNSFDQVIVADGGSNAWNDAFMKMTNLAKQLELNVSISMKYLEELSQNYKQQTEKLRKSQIQVGQSVKILENLLYRYREETDRSINELKKQLHGVGMRWKYGIVSPVKKPLEPLLNGTSTKESDESCEEYLTEDDLSWSWFESYFFLIGINLLGSVAFNSLLVFVFYRKIKQKIVDEIEKSFSFSKRNVHAKYPSTPTIATSSSMLSKDKSFSTSQSNITSDQPIQYSSSFPIVLPPRGVHIPTLDTEYFSDDDKRSCKYNNFRKHFYMVKPNFDFVTPTKDRKKKKRK